MAYGSIAAQPTQVKQTTRSRLGLGLLALAAVGVVARLVQPGSPAAVQHSSSLVVENKKFQSFDEAGMPPQEEVEEPTDTSTVTAETAPHVRTFNGAMAEPMSRETYEAIAKTLDGQVLDIDTLKASKASALSTFKSSAPGPEKEQAAKVFDANSAALLTFMTFSKAAESGQR
eukprot:SAG11_NODE_2188_length_3709_cov_6.287812_4_plen_173_part_00